MGKGREFWLVENNLCIQAFTEKPEMHPNWTLPVTHVREVTDEADHAATLADALDGMIKLDEGNCQRYPGDEDVCMEVRLAREALAAYRASQKGGNHD